MRTRRPRAQPALWAIGLLFLVPTEALAQDYNLCVVSDGSTPASGCGQDCDASTGMLPSVAAALAATLALPDQPTGQRPSVRICVTGPNYHPELVRVESQPNGSYANGLVLETDGTTLCSDGSDSEAPLVSWQTGSSDLAQDRISVHMDLRESGPCGHTGPGIEAYGTASLLIENTVILGSSSYAVASGINGSAPIRMELHDSHILGCRGMAISSRSTVALLRSEVVGCHLSPSSSAEGDALLLGSGDDAGFDIASSTVFGNLVDGAGLIGEGLYPALISGPIARIERSLLAANVLTTGAPLIRTPIPQIYGDLSPQSELFAYPGHWLFGSVISRNRHVLSLTAEQPEAAQPALWHWPGDEFFPSCAALDQLAPYAERPAPAAEAAQSSGPLLQFLELSNSSRLGVTMSHSFFVGNRVGQGPLISLDTQRAEVGIQILQNTFADNGAARLLAMEEGQPNAEVVVARNLWVATPGETAAEPMLVFTDPPASLTVTMNSAPGPLPWFADNGEADHTLIGPNPSFGEQDFIDPTTLEPLSECDRFKLTCPSAQHTPCEALPWLEMPCAVDEARNWLPGPALVAAIGPPWPWETAFFLLDDESTQAPGATGGSCEPTRISYDTFEHLGDGDGYPDLVDCDNEDWELRPAVPEDNGYSSEFCDAADSPCYLCPEGTGPRPEPEPEPEPEAYDGSYHEVNPGCTRGGCGISYDCSGGGVSAALLLLLPLGRRRRR